MLVIFQGAYIGAARPLNTAQVKLYHEPETIAHSMVHVSETTTVWGVARIMVTEVLGRHDPRSVSPQMEDF